MNSHLASVCHSTLGHYHSPCAVQVLGFRWQQQSVVFSFSWMEWCPEMGPAQLVSHQWTVVETGNGEGDPSYLLDDENGPVSLA